VVVPFDELVVVGELGFLVQLLVEDPEPVREEPEDGAQDQSHNAARYEQGGFVVEVQDVLCEPDTTGGDQESHQVHDGKEHCFAGHIGLFAVAECPIAVGNPGEDAGHDRGNGLGPDLTAVHRSRKEPDING
jgi:hypothetical protein